MKNGRTHKRRHTPGGRLDQLIAQFSMLSEVASVSLEQSRYRSEGGPPGSFAAEGMTADEVRALVNRLADLLEVELSRVKGGGLRVLRRVGTDKESVDNQLLDVLTDDALRWISGDPDHFRAYLTGIPHEAVARLRRSRREAA